MRAIGEPTGFAFLLVHGPTGVGKTEMIDPDRTIKEIGLPHKHYPLHHGFIDIGDANSSAGG